MNEHGKENSVDAEFNQWLLAHFEAVSDPDHQQMNRYNDQVHMKDPAHFAVTQEELEAVSQGNPVKVVIPANQVVLARSTPGQLLYRAIEDTEALMVKRLPTQHMRAVSVVAPTTDPQIYKYLSLMEVPFSRKSPN